MARIDARTTTLAVCIGFLVVTKIIDGGAVQIIIATLAGATLLAANRLLTLSARVRNLLTGALSVSLLAVIIDLFAGGGAGPLSAAGIALAGALLIAVLGSAVVVRVRVDDAL